VSSLLIYTDYPHLTTGGAVVKCEHLNSFKQIPTSEHHSALHQTFFLVATFINQTIPLTRRLDLASRDYQNMAYPRSDHTSNTSYGTSVPQNFVPQGPYGFSSPTAPSVLPPMPLSRTPGNTPNGDAFAHSLHTTTECAPTAGMSQQHWQPASEHMLVDQQYKRAWTGQDFRGPIMRDAMQGATPQQSLDIHARPQRQMDHASDPTRIRAAALRNRQRRYPHQDKGGRSEASPYILASVSSGDLPASTGTKRGPVVDHTQGDDAEASRPSKRVVNENSFAQFGAHEGRWRPGTHMPAHPFGSSPLPFGTTPHTPPDQLSQPDGDAALHAAPQTPDMTTYLSGGLHAYSRHLGHPFHRPASTVSSVASRVARPSLRHGAE